MTASQQTKRLDRRLVVRRLLSGRQDTVVVSGLGAPTYDVAAAGDHERNFYLWGAMGGAALVGLGLAIAKPALPILVITGDGEMLMGLGALATIALQRPANLTVAILDNEAYGETGGQASHTARGVDLSAAARACGIADAHTLTRIEEVEAAAARAHRVGDGPRVLTIKIDPTDLPRVLPSRDGALLARRLQTALDVPSL